MHIRSISAWCSVAIPRPRSSKSLAWLAPMLVAGLLAGCATGASSTGPALPTETTSTGVTVALQERREWVFAEDGVRFDNRLPGARLNAVTRKAAGHYIVEILPETTPINPSPWYGFRVGAGALQALQIDFEYPGSRHRYHPKLGSGDGTWRQASRAEFTPAQDGQPAQLQVEVGPDPLLVFAQPPTLPGDIERWIDALARKLPIERSVIGHSVHGRPLHLFEFGGDDSSPLLVVVGRQHPPEKTGSDALAGFIETLAGDTPQARAFRERVRTIVMPLANPDGLVEGHWRTNLRGKDLNRDWGPFTEPETQAIARALLERSEGESRRVVFAVDFHSTFRDVLYTVTEDPSRGPDGVLGRWIAATRTQSPELEELPSPAFGGSPVFKNWAYCRFGAPAVTYEVADTTAQAALEALARHAALSLIEVLDDETVVATAAPAPGCEAAGPGNDNPVPASALGIKLDIGNPGAFGFRTPNHIAGTVPVRNLSPAAAA